MNLLRRRQHVSFLCLLFVLWTCLPARGNESSDADDVSSASSATTSDDGTVLEVDPKGYIIYCPCMGRFGNQADHFLGSLGFAKQLNRTLIIPPWRTYKNVPFDEWFRVEAVQLYYRVITAENFMRDLAPTVWPEGSRIGWCWLQKTKDDGESYCPMKEGNPFGPFWDGLGVNFDRHMVYKFSYTEVDKWKNEYPGDKFPVIALKGAPASFPVREHHVPLHRYLQWSDLMESQANDYINTHFPGETFVGIHLRNGPDWVNACSHIKGSTSFMASPQCLGYKNNKEVTKEICIPSVDIILSLTKEVVESTKATTVYVATDKDPMLDTLKNTLGDKVKVIHQDPWLPQLDLIILGKSDHFIGNCVSSFTAFVTRERLVTNKPTSFWGFSPE
ncbi:GDP-fucose protein O-fucosyltransferase 1-like [Littorina saxatilis]|uniref:GDP-fucose protein O-fucosyltransferase 1 n=1 Tax=Littorina saxatilis TaxID=31220 RepID=A0AAN9B948_9CAEN